MPHPDGFSRTELREKEAERAGLQPLKAACAICGKTWEGIAAQVIEKARKHRLDKHPKAVNTRKKRHMRSLNSFRYVEMDDESKDEIEEERRKRAFLLGVNITND